MPQTFLVFDFGTDEAAAQQARHRIEGWRQAFRLGDRMQFKFERQTSEPSQEKDSSPASADQPKEKKESEKKREEPAVASEPAKEPVADRLRLMVRLDFSDHERLTHQLWLERIPAESSFPVAEKQVLRRGQEGFDAAAEKFDSLP